MSDALAVPSPRGRYEKRDKLPRGIFRRRDKADTALWIRYECGRRCPQPHKERMQSLSVKDAVAVRKKRLLQVKLDTKWCPKAEREQERAQRKARVTFWQHALTDYISWAQLHHKSWRKDRTRLNRVLAAPIGSMPLDGITTAHVERFLSDIQTGDKPVGPATANRYRDLLSGLFKRAKRLGLVQVNPVTGIPKHKESAGRTVFLTLDAEAAVLAALPVPIRPAFTLACETGLRWSEQATLRWREVDVVVGHLTVARSKNGSGRPVPLTPAAQAVLVDLATRRRDGGNPGDLVFKLAYRTVARAVDRAVAAAIVTLRTAGKATDTLEGFSWHGCRHTWASRAVMAGVDPRTLQAWGGWKTLSQVQRYAHLAPGHLLAAAQKLDAWRKAQATESDQESAPLVAPEPKGSDAPVLTDAVK